MFIVYKKKLSIKIKTRIFFLSVVKGNTKIHGSLIQQEKNMFCIYNVYEYSRFILRTFVFHRNIMFIKQSSVHRSGQLY